MPWELDVVRLPPPIDQEVFYANLQAFCRTEAERAVVVLLWRTGMHPSTLIREWFSIGKDGTVHWPRTKTGKWLTAHTTVVEARVIIRCLTAGSLPNTQGILRRWLRRIGDRAGYPEVTPLTLRHSRAIYLLDAGRPINRVAALLGCSWAVLERHYAVIENAREVMK